jgi:pimeloyl-ACP methyl ester carboxylesterase
LQQGGALEAALGDYRAMFDPARADPALAGLRAEQMTDQGRYFSGPCQYQEVDAAGHFLHREQPQAVNRLLLDWLA